MLVGIDVAKAEMVLESPVGRMPHSGSSATDASSVVRHTPSS
jgi:hypothetical protein